jgi:hypothetical protein
MVVVMALIQAEINEEETRRIKLGSSSDNANETAAYAQHAHDGLLQP